MKSQINKKFDHSCFALQPHHSPLQQHPTINDDLPNRIINGTIIIKPNIDHFTKSGVVFNDGTSVSDLDAVIFCTGYNIGFSFIDKSIIPVDNNDVTLYKYVFPPHHSKPTLAVIGCFQPLGAINPVADLQCRWATRVFKGILKLPNEREMVNEINDKKEEMTKRYYTSRRHTIQVNSTTAYKVHTIGITSV
jgi:dimethylaniline monooxygenase (N-oxide forming)